MAYNVTRFANDRRLQVASEEVFFPLPFGNRWLSLKIGLLFQWNCCPTGNAIQIHSKSLFGVSVCNGLLGCFSPNSDCIIACLGQNASGGDVLATYTSAGDPGSYVAAPGSSSCQKVNGLTYGASGYNSNAAMAATLGDYKEALVKRFSYAFFEINRSGGNCVNRVWGLNSNMYLDYTLDEFVLGMSQDTPTNTANIGGTNHTFTLSQPYGTYYDNFSIFNAVSVPRLNIAAVAVHRLL